MQSFCNRLFFDESRTLVVICIHTRAAELTDSTIDFNYTAMHAGSDRAMSSSPIVCGGMWTDERAWLCWSIRWHEDSCCIRINYSPSRARRRKQLHRDRDKVSVRSASVIIHFYDSLFFKVAALNYNHYRHIPLKLMHRLGYSWGLLRAYSKGENNQEHLCILFLK